MIPYENATKPTPKINARKILSRHFGYRIPKSGMKDATKDMGGTNAAKKDKKSYFAFNFYYRGQ